MSADAFHTPATIEEAVAALAVADAAPLAGGATLMAILNAGLLEPAAIVSLRGIEALRRSERLADGSVHIGAMRLHREIAADEHLTGGQRVVADAAGQIGNPAIRNMGTIGGSVAFADPAADYLPALLVADAVIDIAGSRGSRSVAAADFFQGWMETDLAEGEIVTGVTLPPAPEGSVGIYRKVARVAGDFAVVGVAAVVAMDGETCREVRVGIGGCNPAPVRVPAAEAVVSGKALTDDVLRELAQAVAAACDPPEDVRGTAAYRRKVLPRLIVRTVRDAVTLCDPGAEA